MTITGLTGEIKFDQKGQRSNFSLELFEINDGIKSIGIWNYFSGLNLNRLYTPVIETEEFIPVDYSIKGKHLIVQIALVSLFIFLISLVFFKRIVSEFWFIFDVSKNLT
jgi:hypothetical protein